jgi:demethylmenaquinone methyltransferase / 2-methoxy-6-polyprenyl-1,4-benzoquinol methylase
MEKGKWGLGEEWTDVEDVLQKILPVYDKTNKIISFGQDQKYRQEGLSATIKPGDLILDAGCGPGNMSKTALPMAGETGNVALLDPLPVMLATASKRLPSERIMPVQGLFEHIPFKQDAFDSIITGFAIRDSRDMKRALSEIARVATKRNGRFLTVDLGKPDSDLSRWRVALFWRIVVPFIALIYLGRKGLLYRSLYRTYRRHPRNNELQAYLKTLYDNVELRVKALGAVSIFITSEPKRQTKASTFKEEFETHRNRPPTPPSSMRSNG